MNTTKTILESLLQRILFRVKTKYICHVAVLFAIFFLHNTQNAAANTSLEQTTISASDFNKGFVKTVLDQRKKDILLRFFEGTLICLVIGVTLRSRKIREQYSKIPKPICFSMIGLGIVSIAAQTLTFDQYKYPHPSELFPFTRYAMFVGSTEKLKSITCQRYEGTTVEGETIKINPFHAFRSIRSPTLFTKIKFFANAYKENVHPSKKILFEEQSRSFIKSLHEYYAIEKGIELKSITFYENHYTFEDRNNPIVERRNLDTYEFKID